MLVFEDVDDRHPMQPWCINELDRVVAAMEDLSVLLTSSPLPAAVIGTTSDKFVRGWRRLRSLASSSHSSHAPDDGVEQVEGAAER